MRKLTLIIFFAMTGFGSAARADIYGGDVIVLTQILTNAVQQLNQMMSMVRTTKDTLGIMQDIHRGVNDSLNLARIRLPQLQLGSMANYGSTDQAMTAMLRSFGAQPDRASTGLKDIDRTAAEALNSYGAAFRFGEGVSQLGNEIDSGSHLVSSSGASKLTAQGVGLLVKSESESLKTQATSLKLQAQEAAARNHEAKTVASFQSAATESLGHAMKTAAVPFELIRF